MLGSNASHDRECRTHTLVMQGDATVTSVKTFPERLLHARTRAGLSQTSLAKKAGVSAGAIGNYEAGAREMPRDVLSLASALGVRPEWLTTGKGPMNRELPTSAAHPLSLADISLSSPVIEWGALGMKTLPKAFKVAAPDDSMAPRLKAGQIAEFEVGLELRPGDGVLVRDSEGEPCIRRCRRARGSWEAYAEDGDNHLPFPFDAEQVLAVLVGVHARWS